MKKNKKQHIKLTFYQVKINEMKVIIISKTYKIKGNEQLFEDWLRVSASPHTKLGNFGAAMVQNDIELSADQLNEWYEHCGELIAETEQHFTEVIEELKELRKQTVQYIKQINN